LTISKHLFVHNKIDTAYRILTRVLEQSESNFKENPSHYKLFIESALTMIELEYELDNLVQARFHLRKLLYLQLSYLSNVNKIIYWAALLDELIHFVKRDDWQLIKPSISGDALILANLYEQLTNYQVSKLLMSQIETEPFQDKRLERKRHTYKQLLRKLTKTQKIT